MVFASLLSLFPILLLSCSANAHGVLTAISGANGVTAQGFGVIASTPRTGSTPNPFEQDTSVIRQNEIQSGKTGVCGRTKAGGDNDVTTQLNAAVASGLPSAAADGTVTMTLHQVNGDGAGPYNCVVSTDATGSSFIAMTVTTNVPGENSRSNAKATDFPLVAQLPPGTSCTGGANGDACLVRCTNSAQAGPFGGCAAITTSNSTADASADSVATNSTTASVADATEAVSSATAASAELTASSLATASVDEAVVESTATVAASAAAAPTATSSKAKGLKGKLATVLGNRATGEGLEARMEERVRRSRVFAGVRG